MSPLQIQWDRIRRRWVLILVIGIVAAAGSLGASLLQGTTYTGRAALTIVSQDRAPEQDTVLAQGYADYFNQNSSQQELRQNAGVDPSVTLNARIAAASPIVYVEATSRDPQLSQDAATRMAVALRDDVNEGVGGDNTAEREQLQRDLAAAQGRNDSAAVSRIQGDLRELDAPGSNELRDLQLTAGVAANSTNAVRNAGAAFGGGLLFGVLLAMALGRFENRMVTPNEVRDRLGLGVLAVVGGARRRGDKGDARATVLRSLMGLTDAYGMPSPGTLAITGPHTTRATKTKVAVAIAGLRALQGQQTLLLLTDMDGERVARELAELPGVAEFLAERGGARIDGKVFSNGRALLVGPPGRARDDVFALYSKPHVQRLLQQGVALADLVIVDAPPAESVEGQIVCGAADRSLLVIEEGETRAKDATNAVDALDRVGATALGVVLVRNPGQLDDTGFLSEGPWKPVAPPAKSAPADAQQAPQYAPANRTQPISREKLDEARAAAAARESAKNAAPAVNGSPTNGAAVTSGAALNGGSTGTAAPPTPGPSAPGSAAGNAGRGGAAVGGGSGESGSGPGTGESGASGGSARPGPTAPGSGPTPRPQPSSASDQRPGPASSGTGGSTGAGSTPAGSTPAGSTPAGSTPAGSTPAGSTPAGSTPAGSGPSAGTAAAAGAAGALGAAAASGAGQQSGTPATPGTSGNASPGTSTAPKGPNGQSGSGTGPSVNGPAGTSPGGHATAAKGQGGAPAGPGPSDAKPAPGKPNPGGSGPGKPNPGGPGKPNPGGPGTSGPGASSPNARPGGPTGGAAPAAGAPRRGEHADGGQGAASQKPAGPPREGEQGPAEPGGGVGAPGNGPNVRRSAVGARPSPRPKPSPGTPAPSGPSATGGQSGPSATGGQSGPSAPPGPSGPGGRPAAAGPGAPSSASSAPPGSKRIGIARFTDGATPHPSSGQGSNGNGRGGPNGTSDSSAGDRLAAPTVTMRPDK